MAATAYYPQWVLLDDRGEIEAVVSNSSTADDRTSAAAARTSTGHLIVVSLRLAAPPATSSMCVHFPAVVPPDMQKESTYANVLAAHGDSLVIYVYFKQGYENQTIDYFVYNAGDASGEPPRPPSLLLLPPLHVDEVTKSHIWGNNGRPVPRWLDRDGTGVLRRGEDEIVVAELKLVVVSWDTTSETKEAELRVVRSAQWSWSVVKRAAVVVDGGGQDRDLLSLWKTDTVFPIGEAQLCWVDLYRGLLFCSIFDENPMLHHAPAEATTLEPVTGPRSSRGVSVTSAGSTVKFVGVFPRCCCGGTVGDLD
nr:unnamed protein product [Digitaria exilis]